MMSDIKFNRLLVILHHIAKAKKRKKLALSNRFLISYYDNDSTENNLSQSRGV